MLSAEYRVTKRATLQSLFFQTSHPAGRIRDARCLIGPLTDLQGTATQIIELFHTQIKGPGIRENLRIEQNFACLLYTSDAADE